MNKNENGSDDPDNYEEINELKRSVDLDREQLKSEPMQDKIESSFGKLMIKVILKKFFIKINYQE